MKSITSTNSNTSIQRWTKENPPLPGSLDYYIYARTFPKILEVLTPAGDMKAFDKDLTALIDKTIVELGYLKANLSQPQRTDMLNRLRAECFNYFSTFSVIDLKLCFHKGARGEYGDVHGFSISTIHKWMDAYKVDEDRLLAIRAEENQLEELKQKLKDEERRKPKIRYMQMFHGLVSLIDQYLRTGNAGPIAWVYYDEFRDLKMIKIGRDGWDAAYELAKQFELAEETNRRGRDFQKIVGEIQAGESKKVENTTKRILLQRAIDTAIETDWCLLTAYEAKNIDLFYGQDYDDPEVKSLWDEFMVALITQAFEAHKKGSSFKGMHTSMYAFLLDKLKDEFVMNAEKQKFILTAQEEVYEVFSDSKTISSPRAWDYTFDLIKNNPGASPVLKHEAKYLAVKKFFTRIEKDNVKLDALLCPPKS